MRRIVLVVLLAAAGPWAQAVDTDPSERVAADPDVIAARAARERGDWKEAVLRLQRAERRYPGDADVQNSLGHALRQTRDFDGAFRHYGKALQIDPRHRGAHEYIGEAYLQVDDLASAERHLAALRGICMLPCEEMQDLDKAIADYRAKKR
ncbi:tetratricopeptide repeat protein [Ramlibacter sp. XY19]|uniref:tetratricopeptide repeat protein n=1 Tax=Ramlibacter paludis TaxID=2908000 RepID=UPI0023DB3E25|nr:tetratricopeptide repeat protein [Ramlibacter paludis]MCG2593402.1 tetratricopeptide repeat protein [Ramlibacter paludis]